jgi:hypothetical protein
MIHKEAYILELPFLDYVQLHYIIPKKADRRILAVATAEMLYGDSHEHIPPNYIKHNRAWSNWFIADEKRGVKVYMTAGDVRIHFSGSFLPRGFKEGTRRVKKFYVALMDNMRQAIVQEYGWEHRDPKLTDWINISTRTIVANTSVSVLHLATNVYSEVGDMRDVVIKGHKAIVTRVSESGFADEHFPLFEYEQKQKGLETSIRWTPGEEYPETIYVGNRGKKSIQMVVYDKAFEPEEESYHDLKRFGTTDFLRWEYRLGRLYIKKFMDKLKNVNERTLNAMWLRLTDTVYMEFEDFACLVKEKSRQKILNGKKESGGFFKPLEQATGVARHLRKGERNSLIRILEQMNKEDGYLLEELVISQELKKHKTKSE